MSLNRKPGNFGLAISAALALLALSACGISWDQAAPRNLALPYALFDNSLGTLILGRDSQAWTLNLKLGPDSYDFVRLRYEIVRDIQGAGHEKQLDNLDCLSAPCDIPVAITAIQPGDRVEIVVAARTKTGNASEYRAQLLVGDNGEPLLLSTDSPTPTVTLTPDS
jgi:hypothetical protein